MLSRMKKKLKALRPRTPPVERPKNIQRPLEVHLSSSVQVELTQLQEDGTWEEVASGPARSPGNPLYVRDDVLPSRFLDSQESIRCLRLPQEPVDIAKLKALDSLYMPLPSGHIRVLSLEDDPSCPGLLKCSFRSIVPVPHEGGSNGLQPSSGYAAVSYTWLNEEYSWYGMPIPDTTALCINGELVCIPGKVALILSCLLRRGITTAWVDAICINQTDQVEKGEQVSIMGAIYMAAEEVVIVLGKPTANTDQVFTPADLSPSSFPIFDRGTIEILSHKYWLRAWILQEVGLANKIRLVCGNAEYRPPDFDALAIALHKGRKNNFESYAGERALESISTTYDRALESPLKILGKTSRAQCSDSRDALYSKRELIRDPELIGYPDYNISANELFIRFAMNSVNTGRLDILHHTLGKRDLKLPSWVPDWTPGRHQSDKQAGFNADRLFHLDSDTMEDEDSQRGLISVDQQVLIVTGIILKQMCEPHDPSHCHLGATDQPNNETMACTFWGLERVMPVTYLCQIDHCELPVVLQIQGDHWKVMTADDQGDIELWLAHERHHFDGKWDWPVERTVFRIK